MPKRRLRFLTVNDMARRAGVSADAVRLAENRGEINAHRTLGGMRLFTEEEANSWISRRRDRGVPRPAA
jgi:excisionase family DNA binding protein